MPNSANESSQRILDAALRLFAEKGVSGATSQEILDAAGQRNSSAIQYHFGSRSGLIDAVASRHQEPIEAERSKLLAELDNSPRMDLVEGAICLILPPAKRLITREGRDGIRIINELVLRGTSQAIVDVRGPQRTSLRQLFLRLSDSVSAKSEQIRKMRVSIAMGLVSSALADRSIVLEKSFADPNKNGDFIQELVGATVAVLSMSPMNSDIPLLNSCEPPFGLKPGGQGSLTDQPIMSRSTDSGES